MKKLLLSLAACVMIIAGAQAQTEQGGIMAGGSVGLNFGSYHGEYDGNKGDKTKTFDINFAPKIGYFVSDGLAVGLGINLNSHSEKEDGDDDKYTSNTFLISPFVRYYSSVGLFGDASIGIGSQKSKYGSDGESKDNVFGWSLGAGYAIFLNDHVSIEPMISYNHMGLTDGDDSKYKTKVGQIMIQVGFNIFL